MFPMLLSKEKNEVGDNDKYQYRKIRWKKK